MKQCIFSLFVIFFSLSISKLYADTESDFYPTNQTVAYIIPAPNNPNYGYNTYGYGTSGYQIGRLLVNSDNQEEIERTYSVFSINSIPANATITGVTLVVGVSGYINGNYTFNITQISNPSGNSIQKNWTNIGSGSSLFSTIKYSSGSGNYTSSALTSLVTKNIGGYIYLGAYSSTEGSDDSYSNVSLSLKITYTVAPSTVSFTIDNNFQAPDGTDGQVIVNGQTYSAPHTFSNIPVGLNFTLQAVSPQTDNQGYQRIWSTGGVNLSNWTEYLARLSYNMQFTFPVTSIYDGKTFIANLRKLYTNISFQNALDIGGNGGYLYVNNTQYASPAPGFQVVEQNAIPAQALDQVINGVQFYFFKWSDGTSTYSDQFTPSGSYATCTAYLISKDALSASGPQSIIYGNNGTWTASVTAGFPPYNYQWYYMYPNPNGQVITNGIKPNVLPYNTWYPFGTNSNSLTTSFVEQAELKCVVTDSKSLTGTSNILNIAVTFSKMASNGSSEFSKSESNVAGDINVDSYSLSQNSPNPFNPSTVIKYQIPVNNFVTLKVYDMLGREVKILVNEQQQAGVHSVTFDAAGLSSGIYLEFPQKSGRKVMGKEYI